jgi:hypothetical protein
MEKITRIDHVNFPKNALRRSPVKEDTKALRMSGYRRLAVSLLAFRVLIFSHFSLKMSYAAETETMGMNRMKLMIVHRKEARKLKTTTIKITTYHQ